MAKQFGNFGTRIRVDTSGLEQLRKKSPAMFQRALEVAALQFLTWANAGSSNEPAKPPIRWGVLRGSSSAFVGSKKVDDFEINIKSGAKEEPTPASAFNGRRNVITWVWNTPYAARMHETQYKPGEFSAQDGNAGPKWLEKHLRADKDKLTQIIAAEMGNMLERGQI